MMNGKGPFYMKDKLIIFGAGKKAISEYEWAISAGYEVLFFVDNDSDKWGKQIQGIQVCSPVILKEYRCTIAYPDQFQKEINKQLEEMKYQGDKISFNKIKKMVVCEKHDEVYSQRIEIGKKTNALFDAYFREMNWGGVESWSCMVGNQLSKIGVKTQILCGMNKRFDEFADYCIHFKEESELFMVKRMAEAIANNLPCIFFSHGSIALYAAEIIKSAFPNHIQIVLVAHGDVRETYENLKFWSDRVDKILCISEKIKSKLEEQYKIKQELLVYRPNPIPIPNIGNKKLNLDKPLKIGFAARLRKEQKRTHLLPDIIETCMEKKLNVEFYIVGEGECQELLKKYISDRHLGDKVHLLGWIPPTEMISFWREQDIYLNISDFEGMSLAMLEAMACGTVPIVTEVSGVSDLIEDGKNGFVVPVYDWLECVDKIEMLDKNRVLMGEARDYNIELIRKKCDISEYVEWLGEMFQFC